MGCGSDVGVGEGASWGGAARVAFLRHNAHEVLMILCGQRLAYSEANAVKSDFQELACLISAE